MFNCTPAAREQAFQQISEPSETSIHRYAGRPVHTHQESALTWGTSNHLQFGGYARFGALAEWLRSANKKMVTVQLHPIYSLRPAYSLPQTNSYFSTFMFLSGTMVSCLCTSSSI